MYATQDDIVTLYSEDALYVADRNGDGLADADAVERALGSASSEIDTYLGVRFPLPLVEWPPIVTQYCVDIALYRMALNRSVLTEEHRTRYDDALKALQKIAEGKATLNLASANSDGDGAPVEPDRPKPIVVGGPPRLFTRENMSDL